MKKRFLSLLCVLALCLGLLPVTALAAAVDAPQTLYVAGQVITDEGYYTQSGDSWTKSSDTSTPPSAPYFHYTKGGNNTPATLTLSGATIQGGTSTVSVPYGAGIYAQCKNGESVSLTIELIGNNTITGHYGIFMDIQQGDTLGANASLNITGDGSLTVTGTDSHGLFVKGGTGNASLNIEKATVTSNTNNSYAAGVYVMSSTSANTPTLSLAVNGGSLTASGGTSGDGIQFYVGSPQATGATTSLTVSENAIVDAKTGGISASRISETLPTPTPTGENSSGIVFNGTEGTVYGDVTLDKSLTINEGETLTVPDGSKLNCNNNLTNNGTILASGGTVTGSLSGGTTPTTPSISDQPQNKEVTAGETATFTVEASAGSETPTYQWQQKTAASGSDWTDISQETSASYTISSTTTSMSGNQYRCIVTSASGVSVISAAATLTVEAYIPLTTYTISADVTPAGAGSVSGGGSYTEGTSVTLTATNNPGYRFVGWVEGEQTVSTDTTYTFTANSDRSLTAQFDRISSGGGDSDPTYSITLPSRVTGGELKLSRRYAEKGETVTITAIPDEGYELDTLTVTDSKGKEIDLPHKGGNEYTFKMPAGRVEIEVSFREIAVELPFTDVPEGVWYEDAAAYVYEHGLMAGTSATTFAPDATTSRSMIATILWRMEGRPVVNYAMDYTDVAQGQWYSEAIRWAASEGIVSGYGNGLFGTNDPITREQFAVMLYRYAQEQGYDVSIGENTNILSYTDVADLSEYAISAMQWAVGAGIINGTGDDSTLIPQGQATRAQAAVMLQRFCEKYAYTE
nr:S-layer homology domain-containing protein [uncultured Agathobaculum sp.]